MHACMRVLSRFRHVQLFATLRIVAHQVPLSVGFSRQEYWSGLPFPSPGDLLTQGLNPGLPHYRQTLYHLSHQRSPQKMICNSVKFISLKAFHLLMMITIIRSDQISRSVVSDSLRPHESQHARPPCPSPTAECTQTHVHRVSDAIQPSHPLLSPSSPAPNRSQHYLV